VEQLKKLLLEEAISNYIVGIIAVATGAIGWIFSRIVNRRKPSIIQVAKLFESSLIDVHPRIREKLAITYDNLPIDGFHEVRFMIQNLGNIPIENVRLVFAIDGLSDISFLEVVFSSVESIEEFTVLNPSDTGEGATVEASEVQQDIQIDPTKYYDPVALDPDAFSVYLPFLNPRKVYEDYLGITLYAPKPLKVKGVVGKGLGWTTKYVDATSYYESYTCMLTKVASPIGYLAGRLTRLLVK
jgi:hypothetical protein